MLNKHVTYALLLFAVLAFSGPDFVWATSLEASSEENIKAAYVFNFAKFVEWPSVCFTSGDAPLNICVMDDETLAKILEPLENKVVSGRRLGACHGNEGDKFQPCHIVYIGELHEQNLHKVLSRFRNKPVLTVSSITDFAEHGGMIGFVRKGNLVRFEVNRQAVADSELAMSSRLLKLALIVDRDDAAP